MQVGGRHRPPALQPALLPVRHAFHRLGRQPQGTEEAQPPPAARAATVTCLSQLCDKFANEVQRRDRRPQAHGLAIAGQVCSLGRRGSRRRPTGRVQVDEPDRLLRRSAARAGDPRHRHRDVPAPAPFARALAPSPPPSPVRPLRASAQRLLGHAELRGSALTSSAYETIPPTKTSLDPATEVSRAATRPPVHDSRGRKREARARARLEVEHEPSSTGDSRAAVQVLARRCPSSVAPLEALRGRPRALPRPDGDEQIDVDLEVARADRHSRSRRRRRRRPRAPRRRATPPRRRSAATRPGARQRAPAAASTGSASSARVAERSCSSRGRAGQRDHDRMCRRSSTTPAPCPRGRRRRRRPGSVACLRMPRSRHVRPPGAGRRREARLDLRPRAPRRAASSPTGCARPSRPRPCGRRASGRGRRR